MRRAAALVLLLALAEATASAADKPRKGLDLAEIQGLMAVQHIDGWLLYDFRGLNPVARELAAPAHGGTRRWFYFIPVRGTPVAVVHKIEPMEFALRPGKTVSYASWRELDEVLRELFKDRKRIAMEYSPDGALPALSRVDGGTLEHLRTLGVDVVSSAELVQTAKSRWGSDGRASHYVAVHHLVALREDALAFVAREVKAGRRVTEWDVQQRIVQGYATRGLDGEPPIVAVGAHTADPHYGPSQGTAAEIRQGDLLLLDMWARQAGIPGAIWADMTWMAYVGAQVPPRYAEVFALVARARDQTVAFLTDRIRNRRPVQGWEADRVARDLITQAGQGERFLHRTGHSIDTNVHGDGVNLDDFETHDTRSVVPGVGFSVEPGIYLRGDFGVRSEIDVYVGPTGLEVTTPVQTAITPIL